MDTLFISNDLFGYHRSIADGLERRGRKVMLLGDRPSSDNLTKALVRLSPSLLARKSTAHFEAQARIAAQHDIRDVLVVKGEALSPEVIAYMRKLMPKARFTLYFWDSFKNMPKNSVDKIDLFNRAFSFDLVDVKADARLMYRPLFYVDEFAGNDSVVADVDVLFVGTAHSDRVEVLERIVRAVPPGYTFKKVLYIRSGLIHRIQRVTDPVYRRVAPEDFIFAPLSRVQVRDLVRRARVIVDIERSIQSGYTMRTIEMLGAGRKLLTTNAAIRNADFYHPANQCWIDRDAPFVDPDFMERAWEPQSAELMRRYSLDGWIDEVLG